MLLGVLTLDTGDLVSTSAVLDILEDADDRYTWVHLRFFISKGLKIINLDKSRKAQVATS